MFVPHSHLKKSKKKEATGRERGERGEREGERGGRERGEGRHRAMENKRKQRWGLLP